MSYVKQNFKSGNPLYAAQLNTMEDAILDLEKTAEKTVFDINDINNNMINRATNNFLESYKGLIGSPLVARTINDMINTDKIYVYVGSESGYIVGHWYYYNGSVWADGGVYNSIAINTDPTLTISGGVADAKVAGDSIISLSDAINSSTGNKFFRNWVFGKRLNTSGDIIDLTGETATSYSSYAYQIIDCIEGDKFTLTGGSANGSFRLWCWCDTDGNVIKKPPSNLTYEDEVIICPAGATKLVINTTTTRKYSICAGVYIDTLIKKKFSNIIDPDDYDGSDSEKIMAAMDAIGDYGHGVILIKRQYSLTANILVKHRGSADARLIFLGIGSNSGFAMRQYAFTSYDRAASYGALSFQNILFTATNIIFNVDYIIRLNFENCVFDGFNHILYGTRFAQTFYFIDCLFRNGTGTAIMATANTEASLIDVRITSCLIEKSTNLIYGYGLHGVYITNCCIEGNDGYVINAKGDCRSVVVKDNYFEAQNVGFNGGANGNGLCFDFTGISGIVHNIEISNNVFLALKAGNKIILLPSRMMEHTKFTVTGNFLSPARSSDPETTPSGAYIVAAHDNATNVYKNLVLGQNSRGYIYDPNHLIVQQGSGNAFVANLIVTEYYMTHDNEGQPATRYNPGFWYVCDDLNELYEPGFYHVSAAIPIAHAPIESDFYLMNIRSNETIIQLAITNNGMLSRIGRGEWH